MSDWHETSWNAVCTLNYGKKLDGYKHLKGLYPVYGSGGIIGSTDAPIAPAGCPIVSRKGTLTAYWSPTPAHVIDTVFWLEPKECLASKWAYYAVKYLDISRLSSGSAVPSLSRDDFYREPIKLPPMSDQKAIAHILGTLDDKIDINKQMNETLEEISKAIFLSWFVDFEPVRAKMEGRPTGLPDNINKLFPDKLLKSETGEIPEGWKVLPLSECSVEIESGRRPKGGIDKSLTHGIPSVGAESIAPAGEFDFSKVKYVTPEFFHNVKKGKVQNFDVALYKVGGKPGQFIPRVGIYGEGFPFENFFVNQNVFLLRSQELGQPFLYRLIASKGFLDQLIAKGSSRAAQPALSQGDVTESNFIRPTQNSIDAYNEVFFPILERQFFLGKESAVLSELRDTLLPRLISGELRLSDAEKFLKSEGI